MNTKATRKKQTAFRLDADLLDRLKVNYHLSNRIMASGLVKDQMPYLFGLSVFAAEA